jgi:hypothetical protein
METEKLKKAIKGLSEGEAKSLLFHILLRVNLLKETEYSEEEFVNEVREIYRTISDLANERSENNQEGTFKMVHILFGDSPAGSLKVVLKDLIWEYIKRKVSFLLRIYSPLVQSGSCTKRVGKKPDLIG